MKHFLVIAMTAAFSLAGAKQAPAQVVAPGNLFEFGDSFQDSNYYCTGWGTAFGACTNYQNTPMHLGTLSSYAFIKDNDFAIGGTATGPGTLTVATSYPLYPGYPAGTYPNMIGQIASFKALGRTIGANDLVTISYAGNDIVASYATAVGAGLGTAVAGYLSENVNALIGLGGRNFMLFGGMPFDKMTLFGSTIANLDHVSNSDDHAYYTTLNSTLPSLLAGYESTEVHLRILDVNTLANRVIDTPSMYGFIGGGDCLDVAGCASASLAVQNQYPFYKGHPSDAFALIIARYIQNLLISAYQVPAQADLAGNSVQAFSSSLISRLNSQHLRVADGLPEQETEASDKMPAQSMGKLTLFASGNYKTGTGNDRTNAYGMDWHQGEGMAGAEYLANAGLRLGLVAGYARPTADLNYGLGSVAFNSYQLAGYASLSQPHWFADAVLSGALNRYTLSRPGVIDTLTASPKGSSFATDLQGGYLFSLKALQFGPIAGLTYARATVASYSESGDMVLAQSVDSQTASALTGRTGLQFRAPLAGLTTFCNVTAEHSFRTGLRVITTTSVDPNSAVPVYTPVDSGAETYGRLSAGVQARLSRTIALNVDGDATFSRQSGNQRGINGSVSIAF